MSQTPLEAAVGSEAVISYFAGKEGLGIVSKYGGPSSCAKFHIVRKVDKAPDLPEVEETINIESFVPIPKDLLSRILAFFKRVAADHQSEAIVILGWNRKRNKYYIARPACATIGPGHLQYKKGKNKKTVGTIHSHGNFGACFSSTDDEHEKGTAQTAPGIYMVMGNVLSHPEIVSSLAGMGLRKDIKDLVDSGELPVYEMSDREYGWWLGTTQVLREIENKKTGFYLFDPRGNILRWAETKLELVPYADEEDRVRKVTKKREKAAFITENEILSKGTTYYGPIPTVKWGSGRGMTLREQIDFETAHGYTGYGEGSAWKDAFDGFFRHDQAFQGEIVGVRKKWASSNFRWSINNIGDKTRDIEDFLGAWFEYLDERGSLPVTVLEMVCDIVGWETVVDVLVANIDKIDVADLLEQLAREKPEGIEKEEEIKIRESYLKRKEAAKEYKEVEEEEDEDEEDEDEEDEDEEDEDDTKEIGLEIISHEGPASIMEDRCAPRLLDAGESDIIWLKE
jgi:hypothetical protein